jgi:hypothetical protein
MSASSSDWSKKTPIAESSRLAIPACSLHDLNNKLGIIITHCDLLQFETGSDPGTRKRLRLIRDAATFIADSLAKMVRS